MSDTTIRVSEDTADALYELKDRGDSYDQVIQRLLDLHERYEKGELVEADNE